MKEIREMLFEQGLKLLLSSPLGIAAVAVLLLLGAVLWYRTQVRETREAQSLLESERKRPDSIWNQ